VIALGSHALLCHSGPMATQVQARSAMVAAQAIAPLAAEHSIVVAHGNGPQASIEAVIDKDLTSEMLAEDVDADLFLMATDVDGLYLHWGTPEQRRLDRVTPGELASYQFAAGSMGPKPRPRRGSPPGPASGRPSAQWPTSPGSLPETSART
jgi:carbamate kinase